MKAPIVFALVATVFAPALTWAQTTAPRAAATTAESVPLPPDYVIGPEDVLTVVVWREKDLTADVKVRPDGRVSLPLLNDVVAAGLTPEQFRQQVTEAASRYIEQPSVTVIVKEINSRKVFIMGMVEKPGPYPLGGPTTVLQLLAQAGGLREYAKSKDIAIMRTTGSKVERLRFNYEDIEKGRRLEQNILLMPGDTVIVP